MKKTIRVYRHPYAFDLDVEFGTFDEMLSSAYSQGAWDGYQVKVGGSFNKKMDETSRAAFFQVGVQLKTKKDDKTNYMHMPKKHLTEDDVISAKAIGISPWEGTYWESGWCSEELKSGLFPVRADWDGKTLIERWDTKKSKPYYELTGTYRY